MEETVLQDLSGLLVQLSFVPGPVEELTDELEDGPAVGSGLHLGSRSLDRFPDESVPFEQLVVNRELDAVRTQVVGKLDGEGCRHRGAFDSDLATSTQRDLNDDLVFVPRGGDELVHSQALVGQDLEVRLFAHARDLERVN